ATNVDGELIAGPGLEPSALTEQVEIQVKYAGYIDRQHDEVQKQVAHENQPIPADLDYDKVASLSFEVRQRLKQYRPETLGQAARMSGITPAAISLLMVHMKKLQYGARLQKQQSGEDAAGSNASSGGERASHPSAAQRPGTQASSDHVESKVAPG